VLIVDVGPLVAAAATRDRHHARCVELLANAPRPLVVPLLVVTEVAYFLADRGGTPGGASVLWDRRVRLFCAADQLVLRHDDLDVLE